MSRRHEASRRRSYCRRQSEVRRRSDPEQLAELDAPETRWLGPAWARRPDAHVETPWLASPNVQARHGRAPQLDTGS